MTPSETKILILIFNRPDKVRQLISALAKVKPSVIYVSGDGPRKHIATDGERCSEARDLFTNLPWPCTVHTNYSETNLGCRKGPEAGITWFFDQVEAGIILEDDCIPDPSFFNFCTSLLDYYKNDADIMHISGNNFQDGVVRGDGSYYFSLYTHSWGWATWRRAWNKYSVALEQFENFAAAGSIKKTKLSKPAQQFWLKNFRYTIERNDSWDSLWLYTVWLNRGLALIPNKNLVSNIGFDGEATHTIKPNSSANLAVAQIETIHHPSDRKVDEIADEYTFRQHFYQPLSKRLLAKLSAIMSTLWK